MQVLMLAGASSDQWAESRLTAAPAGLNVVTASGDDLLDTDADILVVVPSVSDPLSRARVFRQRRPSGQILFVVPADRLERMRRTLPFSPEISAAWILDENVSAIDLWRHVNEAAASVVRRRAIKGLYGRINAHFGQVQIGERDGTEARPARHAALAERYLTAILADAPDALIATTLDGVVVSWNEAAVRLFLKSEDDISGRAFVDLFLPSDQASAQSLLECAAMGERVRSRELRVAAAGGTVATLDFASGPVLGGNGAIEGVSLIARDVTARKRDEEALRQLNEGLESRVAHAMAEHEVTAAALRHAQKMEAVGQLTGGVAHDFNNLLTIIKSSIEILRRPDLSEERQRRYQEAISDTVDRAAKLTGQLLAFARRQPLKPEAFDATERLQTVVQMLGSIVGGRIEIKTEIRCSPCFVHADQSQFETALINMAVNARDAMDGEGRIIIGLDETKGIPKIRGHAQASGAFVAVSIADTGIGILPDQMEKIFEPFFTTKGVGKGTGLGLSQVFGFAKQSGGDVAVSSEPGRGTTFTLYLPRVAHGSSGITREHEAEKPLAREFGRRVLVVEDNVEVGRFVTQILQDLGHEITWAANAPEALTLLTEDSDRFDIVFSDVVMPGMNGIELGQAIRTHYPGLPVVLASGYSHVLAEEGRHGFELVQKPYATAEVSRIITRHARCSIERRSGPST